MKNFEKHIDSIAEAWAKGRYCDMCSFYHICGCDKLNPYENPDCAGQFKTWALKEAEDVVDEADAARVKRFEGLLMEMLDTFKRKNHDYGDSFHDSFVEFGLVAAVVRMNDKMNRLKTLAKKKDAQVKDESIRDTLLDLANYSVMTAMEMDENKKTEVEE